jgi:hypothetical protein
MKHTATKSLSIFAGLLLVMTLTLASSAFAANDSQIPIAYGSISAIGGTLQTGTTNITKTFIDSNGFYEVTLKGVCFDRLDYTVVATVSGYNGWPTGAAFVNTDDDGSSCHLDGNLYIKLYDSTGAVVQDDVQFVVFKVK